MLRIKLVKYENLKKKREEIFRDLEEGVVIVVDAKLSPSEEAHLIQDTMKLISGTFSGIELGTIARSHMHGPLTEKFRDAIVEKVLGKKMGITVIGPATIVSRIVKNPDELVVCF
jgi:hypothetical protein